jgi:hypothetical protein
MPNPVADFPWDWKRVCDTVLVKTGPGALHTIVLNGLITEGEISVFDGIDATGEPIGVLGLTPTIASVSVQPITLTYDLKIATGIYIEYDQSVGADLTVTYI